MTDYHVRRSRLSSSGSDDFEDESLDPRIQGELEKLNKASEEINRLELELDDARASFRQTLSESSHKLDALAKKLGSCVEKARPYYDARVKAKDAHLETQRAALRFERACSMHEAAKEMVQLAEQGYMRREQPSDPAWQEMLNHATMKVNEAEKERNESEQEHQRTMIKFKVAEDQVQSLQKDLKRAITKSKPYFEMKAKFNQIMEEHKHKVSVLEEDVSSAKSLYSTALRSLEAISDQIHRQRLERRQQQQLGVRGAGVGAECPLPPPASWEKGLSIDGRDARHASMDPLGVMKMSPVGYDNSGSSHQRSRNLSGESCHGREMTEEEEERLGKPSPFPPSSSPGESSQDVALAADGKGTGKDTQGEDVGGRNEERDSDNGSKAVDGDHDASSPESSPVVLIPGDPLGVLPPTYTSVSSRGSSSSRTSPNTSSISHPAFSGATGSPTHSSGRVAHPSGFQGSSHINMPSAGGVLRSKSTSHPPEKFVSPSAVYSNPEESRRQSYRRAVEASQRDAEDFELPDDLDAPELDEVYSSLPKGGDSSKKHGVCDAVVYESRQRSHSSPVHPSDLKTPRSPPHTIPLSKNTPLQDALADGRKHGSAPEKSLSSPYTQHALGEAGSHDGGTADNGSPTSARRSHKLQGLILRIDPAMDPLRNFEPRNLPKKSSRLPPPSREITATSPKDMTSPNQTPTPTPSPVAPGFLKPRTPAEHPGPDFAAPGSTAIIRSASSVSTAGSERSETDLSEVESVSATQSPTKPHPSRSRLLHVPSAANSIEDSSDTESLASTGPMLDDEQLDFLTLDFSSEAGGLGGRERDDDLGPSSTLPSSSSQMKRNSWSRMSLPPRLSYLEGFLTRAKRLSGEFDSQADDDFEERSPAEEDLPSPPPPPLSPPPESVEEEVGLCRSDEVENKNSVESTKSQGEAQKQEQAAASQTKGGTIVVRL